MWGKWEKLSSTAGSAILAGGQSVPRLERPNATLHDVLRIFSDNEFRKGVAASGCSVQSVRDVPIRCRQSASPRRFGKPCEAGVRRESEQNCSLLTRVYSLERGTPMVLQRLKSRRHGGFAGTLPSHHPTNRRRPSVTYGVDRHHLRAEID